MLLCAVVALGVLQIHLNMRAAETLRKHPKGIWAHLPPPESNPILEMRKATTGNRQVLSNAESEKNSTLRNYFACLWSQCPEYLWIVSASMAPPKSGDDARATLPHRNLRWSTQALMYDIANGAVDVLVFDNRMRRVEPILVEYRQNWREEVPRAQDCRPYVDDESIRVRYFNFPSSMTNDAEFDKKEEIDFVLLCCRVREVNADVYPIDLDAGSNMPAYPDPGSNADPEEREGHHPPPVVSHVVAYSSKI